MDGKSGNISIVDYRRLAEFRYQIRQFVSFSEQAARAAGLEPRQHQLLLAIKGLPIGAEPTVGELAERLQIHHNSAVELINRLEERGLVERQRGEIDRRQVFVYLTAKGEAELSDLSRHHLEELRAIGPQLVQALTSLLDEQRVDEE